LSADEFPYAAEVRLLRWGESSTAGRTITLELSPDAGDSHPFKGFPSGHAHGQRFRMSFAVIQDDETEAPTITPKDRYSGKSAMEKAVARAAILCDDPEFQRWIASTAKPGGITFIEGDFNDPGDVAASMLRDRLKIKSRAEIGTDERAYQEFLRIEHQYRESAFAPQA